MSSCCKSDIGSVTSLPYLEMTMAIFSGVYTQSRKESMNIRGKTVGKSRSNKGFWIKGDLLIQLYTN